MAAVLRVHKNTYARWERGERDPGATDLIPLIEHGWNPLWLLTGDGPERLPDDTDPEVVAKRAAALTGDAAAAEWIRAFEKGFFVRGPLSVLTPTSQTPVRIEALRMALQLADEALQGRALDAAHKAELVSLVYELLEEGLPEAKVLRFARAAAG